MPQKIRSASFATRFQSLPVSDGKVTLPRKEALGRLQVRMV
jgi:hypothetical protein